MVVLLCLEPRKLSSCCDGAGRLIDRPHGCLSMYAWAQHLRVRPLPLARCLVSTKFAAGNEQAVRARKSCSSEVRFTENSHDRGSRRCATYRIC